MSITMWEMIDPRPQFRLIPRWNHGHRFRLTPRWIRRSHSRGVSFRIDLDRCLVFELQARRGCPVFLPNWFAGDRIGWIEGTMGTVPGSSCARSMVAFIVRPAGCQPLGFCGDLGFDEISGKILHLAVCHLPCNAGHLSDRRCQHRLVKLTEPRRLQPTLKLMLACSIWPTTMYACSGGAQTVQYSVTLAVLASRCWRFATFLSSPLG